MLAIDRVKGSKNDGRWEIPNKKLLSKRARGLLTNKNPKELHQEGLTRLKHHASAEKAGELNRPARCTGVKNWC